MAGSKRSEVTASAIELPEYSGSSSPSDVGYGTVHDASDMFRMGKQQELRRNFRFFSIIGFVTVMQCTWESASYFGLYDGGTAGVIWMTIIVWFCMIATIACMAEMASMAPTAGGQYHWVSEFAPSSIQQPLSFLVGWCAFLAWVSGIPTCAQIMTAMVQGLAVIGNPDANILHLWQATLLIFLFLFLTFAFNIFCAKWLPMVEQIMLVVHVIAFLVFLAILWALVDHPPAEQVFTQFYDGGGWGSFGLATLVGIGTPLWCFVGPDAGAHMSEELKDASLQLPRAMMWATIFNGVLGVPMLITFCFCIPSIDFVENSASGQPIMDVIYLATGSYAATCVLGTLLLVLYFFGTCNAIAAASRQGWAFARDGGFPFSSWITQVLNGQPFNALYLCLGISLILSAINFGSDVALNAIISVSNAALIFSYIVSVSCTAWKRVSGQKLLPRRWDLGWMEIPISMVTLAFLWVSFMFSFLPMAPSVPDPAWAVDFNWASVMFAAIITIAFSYYFFGGGKQRYVAPVRLVKQE